MNRTSTNKSSSDSRNIYIEEIKKYLRSPNAQVPQMQTVFPLLGKATQQGSIQEKEELDTLLDDINEIISREMKNTGGQRKPRGRPSKKKATDSLRTSVSRDEALTATSSTCPTAEKPAKHRHRTPSVKQTPSEGQVNTPSHSQPRLEAQVATVTGGDTQTFTGDQTPTGTEMTIQQGSQKESLSENQSSVAPLSSPHAASASLTQEHVPGKRNRKSQGTKLPNEDRVRPHACKYPGCSKAYFSAFTLKEHMNKHSGVKPFVCNTEGCTKKYTYSRDLSRHKKTHLSSSPDQDTLCQGGKDSL